MSTTLPRVGSESDDHSSYIETGLETFQVEQKLTAQDERARIEMCIWFNDKMEEDEDWIDDVWFSDEAHFHLDVYVNLILQRPLHSSKVAAWCAINSKTIVGP